MIGNTLGYLYLNFYNLIYSTYSVNVSDFHKIVQSSQALNQANLHDWLKAGDEYLDTTHQDAGAFSFFFANLATQLGNQICHQLETPQPTSGEFFSRLICKFHL